MRKKGKQDNVQICEKFFMVGGKLPPEMTKYYTVARVPPEYMFCARFRQVLQLFGLFSFVQKRSLFKAALADERRGLLLRH